MKPEVILLSHGFQSEYEIGFANGLVRAGVAVILVGSDNTLLNRKEPGVRVVNLRGSQRADRPALAKAFNLVRYVLSYLWFILRHRSVPVHVIGLFSTRSTFASLVEALLTRIFAGRFVLTVHNLLPHERHTGWNRIAYRTIYRLASRLMVHTSAMKKGLVTGFRIAPDKVVIVEHGFDQVTRFDAALRSQLRANLRIPDSAAVVLMFGVVARYKGVDLLLDAHAALPVVGDVHVVIAGHCRDESLRLALRTCIQKHPSKHKIHWLDGFVPADEVPALLSAADCIALPYRHIDQSGVLFLAISAGLPVVASRVGSLADYVRPGAGAIVPPEDVPALAEGIIRTLALCEVTSRETRIEEARALEWRHTVRPLLPLYEVLNAN
jgi:glycosyltransferase involved in cell wall biosynthesis